MAKKYIKIFDDTILKQTINQGTEDQRVDSVLGTFSSGELAYTRDTGRVFVGDNGSNDENPQTTIGGSLVGNKYLGMIDSAPLAQDIDSEKYTSVDNYYYPEYDEYSNENKNGLLDENSRYRLSQWKNWSREAEYNKSYNAYNGDFMYDAAQNALILFDNNIRLTSSDNAFVKLENSGNNKYIKYYNKKGEALSKNDSTAEELPAVSLIDGVQKDDVKYRTPFVNYNADATNSVGVGPNPKVYGNGFVVFRNVEPDNETISFIKKGFKSYGAAQGVDTTSTITDNNYSHNLLTITKVPAHTMVDAMDPVYFTLTNKGQWIIAEDALKNFDNIGTGNPFTIYTNELVLNNNITSSDSYGPSINFAGTKFTFKSETENTYDYELAVDKVGSDDDIKYVVYPTKKSVQQYYINLGDGLSSQYNGDHIVIDKNATVKATAPTIKLTVDSLNGATMLEKTPFIGWTNSLIKIDTESGTDGSFTGSASGDTYPGVPSTDANDEVVKYNVIFDLISDKNEDETRADKTVLYTLNKSVICENISEEYGYNNWFTTDNVLNTESAGYNDIARTHELFGVAGNNNIKVITEAKRDTTLVIPGFNNLDTSMIENYPKSATPTKFACNSGSAINISSSFYKDIETEDDRKQKLDAFATEAARILIGSGLDSLYSIEDINSTTINKIFNYSYIEEYTDESKETIANVRYNFNNYFNELNELSVEEYAQDDDLKINGPLTFVRSKYGKPDEFSSEYDIFYNAAGSHHSISYIKSKVEEITRGPVENGKSYLYSVDGMGKGVYVTFWSASDSVNSIFEERVDVLIDIEAIRFASTTNLSDYILQKAIVNRITTVGDSDIPFEEYSFTGNNTFTPVLHLPELIKDEDDEKTYYTIEDIGNVIGYIVYTGNSLDRIDAKTVCDNEESIPLYDILNGKNPLAGANFEGVIIYTEEALYTYYIKDAISLKAMKKPGEHSNALIWIADESGATSVTANLNETISDDAYFLPVQPASLIIEIKQTSDDNIEIFASPSIYKLQQYSNNIFNEYYSNGSKHLIADTTEKYNITGSTYTYKLPTIKNVDLANNEYNNIIPNSDKTGGEINIASLNGNDTVIVEVPLTFEPCLNAKSVAFRIAGLTNTSQLTMRVIGYR